MHGSSHLCDTVFLSVKSPVDVCAEPGDCAVVIRDVRCRNTHVRHSSMKSKRASVRATERRGRARRPAVACRTVGLGAVASEA